MRGLRAYVSRRRGRGCRLPALLLAAALLAGPALPAAAIPQGGVEEPVPPAAPAEAADWGELRAWLEQNPASAVTLTGDVTVPKEEFFSAPAIFPNAQAVIDCGAHTLYVEGALYIEGAPGLTITGSGGEEGLIHLREGGQLGLGFLTLAAEAGAALVQEEGSRLYLATREDAFDRVQVTGALRFASLPVLTAPDRANGREAGYFLVPEGEDAQAYLPETRWANLNFQGAVALVSPEAGSGREYVLEQPVTWDLGDAEAEGLAARRRTALRGRFTGPLAAQGFGADFWPGHTPEVLAVFPVNGAALLECVYQEGAQSLHLSFTFDPVPDRCRLLCSIDDGATWTAVGGDEALDGAAGSEWSILSMLEAPEDLDAWYLVEGEYDGPDGPRLVHTDTITAAGAEVRPVDWVDGHRGGREDIIGSQPSPPDVTLTPESPPEPEDTPPPEDTTPPPEAVIPLETVPPEPTPGPEQWEDEEDGADGEWEPPRRTPPPAPSIVVIQDPILTPTPTPEPVPTSTPLPEPPPTPPAETPPAQTGRDAASDGGPPEAARDPAPSSVPAAGAPTALPAAEPAVPDAEPPGETAAPPAAAPPVSGETPPVSAAPKPTGGEMPPSGPPPGAPPEEEAGLSPGAQIALGSGAAAALAAVAGAALNPGAVGNLLRRLRRLRRPPKR